MAEVDGRGGFARLAAIVKAERARGVPMLYAHAGDTLSPSLLSGFDRGAHIVELLNRAPPDVFVPGNHEFDFGPATFAQRMGEASFPVLAANLRDGAGRPLAGLRDRMLVTLGGIRVGVVGIALASTPEKSQAGDLRFAPEIETLAREVQALRAEGVDLVVGVCHTARATDDAIVAARLVDILLSGHDHDLVVRYDGQTVMAESSFDAHYVTAIDVTATVTGTGRDRRVAWRPSFRIHDSAQVTPDPETLAVVQRLAGRAVAGTRRAGGRDPRAPRQPHRHGAGPRGELRQPRGGRHAGRHRGAGRDHQRRRHPGQPALSGRRDPDPPRHPHRTALRQHHRAGLADGRAAPRPPRRGARRLGPPGGALPAGLRPRRHRRSRRAGGQADRAR